MNWLNVLLLISAELFVFGFAYGILRGRDDLHWIIRGFGVGLIFALWFITIPLMLILDR